MTNTPLDIAGLRKIAEAAKLGSHGQWLQEGASRVMLPDKQGSSWDGRLVADVRDPIDVQHVAAFNPATALALLDELQQYRDRDIAAERDAAHLEYVPEEVTDAAFQSQASWWNPNVEDLQDNVAVGFLIEQVSEATYRATMAFLSRHLPGAS